MRQSRRCGMAVILVLAVLAVALVISYSLLRTEAIGVQIANNSSRQLDARQVAMAGMSVALQKMSAANWAGVASTVTGNISSTDSYVVTYTTGDTSLTASDPSYSEYPYRVTLLSTGYSTDPLNPSIRAMHQVRAVVQLIRRKLSDPPSGWTTAQAFTLLQWGNVAATIDVPTRIEGPALFQGPVQICPTYPYDCRPFSGTIDEVALFNQKFDDSDVTAIYAARLNSSTTDAVAKEYQNRNPLSWWRFNEALGALTAVDQLGAHSGTYAGPKLGVSGEPTTPAQTGAWFDGANDFVNCGTFDCDGQARFTICAWVKPDTLTQDQARIVSKASGVNDSDAYWGLSTAVVSGNLRLRFRLKTLGLTTALTASSGNFTAGNWSFIVATYDGLLMKIYKDGTLVGSTVKLGNVNTSATARVYVGDCSPGSSRSRYLKDLQASRAAGGTDMRPLSGTISLGSGRTTALNRSLLEQELKLTTADVTASTSSPMTFYSGATSYQLYPGGKAYTMPVVSGSLSNVTMGPDPIANPLGVFLANSTTYLYDNVTITGTIIVDGPSNASDLLVYGHNVRLNPSSLPLLSGSTQVTQLPTVIAKTNFNVPSGATVTIGGLVAAFNKYWVQQSAIQGTTVTHLGAVMCQELDLEGRNEWVQTADWWTSRLGEFLDQWQTAGVTPVVYFPEYLRSRNLAPEPLTTIKPALTPVAYHWHNWSNPLFQPHPNDGGLRWDLIDWKDNP
ncbi:MAG: LamG domain-containing protein [Planctomycetia bacterium]|nr:LamG domain-containing protein [Planctomycetia bacterium]